MLISLPLLILVVIVYNVLALAGPALMGAEFTGMEAFLASGVQFTMFSGDLWTFTMGDLIVAVGLILLFIEIVKSTRTTASAIINHGLSMLVFIVALVEFIVLNGFATSVFFMITLMTLLDVVAGFTISIVAAKRDLGVSPGIIGTN